MKKLLLLVFVASASARCGARFVSNNAKEVVVTNVGFWGQCKNS
jgi:hypothetical protein